MDWAGKEKDHKGIDKLHGQGRAGEGRASQGQGLAGFRTEKPAV